MRIKKTNNLKLVVVLSFFCLSFFCFGSVVKADTLYWYNDNGGTDWVNINNWWMDAEHSIPSPALPQSNDDTIVLGISSPVIDLDDGNWVEPTSIDATATGGITITSASGNVIGNNNLSNFSGDLYVRGNAVSWIWTQGGNAFFYDDSSNEGILLGNVSLYDTARNNNLISGNTYLYGNSVNYGTVEGDTTLNDSAINSGIIDGNATFNDSSFNGTVEYPGQVTGDAYFMYLTATDGTVTDITGYANGSIGGITYDNANHPISTWIFTSTDNAIATTGNAIFNPNTYNRGNVSGHVFYNNSPDHRMFKFDNGSRTVELGNTVNFGFNMFNKTGAVACPLCTYSVNVFPSVLNSTNISGNRVTGSFTPTKLGTYSLVVDVTNPTDGSRAIGSDMFFVIQPDTTISSRITRYYIRDNLPINNTYKGNGHDTGTLLLSLPEAEENRWCTAEIMNTVDELPSSFPFSSLLLGLDAHIFYKSEISSKIGIERISTATQTIFDMSEDVPSSADYTPVDLSFNNIDWGMNSPIYYYRLGIKLAGPGLNPFWRSTPVLPSYVDLNYGHTTTPAVRTTSQTDTHVLLLSATQSTAGDATLILNYPFSTSTSTTLLLGEESSAPFHRPFPGHTTAINSDGTVILEASGISGITTISSTPLDISPNAGYLEIGDITLSSADGNVTFFPNSWTEAGSGGVGSAEHTVGNLEENSFYLLRVDNGGEVSENVYESNSSGQINFNYNYGGGPSSLRTFSLQLVSEPALSTPSSSQISTNGATLSSSVTDMGNGSITRRGFQYGINTSYGNSTTENGSFSTGAFSASISGLVCNTTYHFRPYAINTGGTGYGSDQTFTTLSCPLVSRGGGGFPIQIVMNSIINNPTENKTVINTPALKNTEKLSTDRYFFKKNLSLGIHDKEVRELQKYLNKNGFTVAKRGVGSKGKENNIFGPATKAALIKFQKAKNIKPAVGYFGPKTREVVNH